MFCLKADSSADLRCFVLVIHFCFKLKHSSLSFFIPPRTPSCSRCPKMGLIVSKSKIVSTHIYSSSLRLCDCQNVQKYSVRCLKVVPGVPKMVLIRSKSKKYPPISSKAACKICPKVIPDGPKMA